MSRYAVLQHVKDMRNMLSSLEIERVAIGATSMGGLMTLAYNALYLGLVTRAVINDIEPEVAETGLNRIQSYVGMVGRFADGGEAKAYLKSASIEIFREWRDSQWEDFARQCYVERHGQVTVDYDPRIAKPLDAESNDTEADTL